MADGQTRGTLLGALFTLKDAGPKLIHSHFHANGGTVKSLSEPKCNPAKTFLFERSARDDDLPGVQNEDRVSVLKTPISLACYHTRLVQLFVEEFGNKQVWSEGAGSTENSSIHAEGV
ncbi:uncharacterized protein KY384_008807 [Bacidia gigantensis]|uniref:uncharacterized protein n=1 Tax=Bacidia gigantensis TaxID=2732470 RepID=UPI001D04FC0C|nr:uncharacterized protein KY384_008807 [Bacidia gigantensis]KAG8526606.1 hypothetical protein KY384_008807 [Bacidia gigantensis]